VLYRVYGEEGMGMGESVAVGKREDEFLAGYTEAEKEIWALLHTTVLKRLAGTSDFKSAPTILQVYDRVLETGLLYINTFHYLSYFLDRDETARELEKRLYELEKGYPSDRSWAEIIIYFAGQLKKEGWARLGPDLMSPYGRYPTFFLPNDIYALVLYPKDYEIEECYDVDGCRKYVIIMVHQGGDIRLNWSDPKVFRLLDGHEPDDFFAWCEELYGSCACNAYVALHVEKWPPEWVWDIGKNAYVCKKCGEPVSFYNPIMD
jgi:hypothetical protein